MSRRRSKTRCRPGLAPVWAAWLAVLCMVAADRPAWAAEPPTEGSSASEQPAAEEPTDGSAPSATAPDSASKPGDEAEGPSEAGAGEPEFDEADLEDEDTEEPAGGDSDSGPGAAEPSGPDVTTQRPVRPPPLEPPIEVGEPPEWERRLEVGGGIFYGSRPLLHDRADHAVSYAPAIGFGFHLRWDLLSFLRIHPYFVDLHHDIEFPTGALTTGGQGSISPNAALSETSATTFSFGARLEPTLWIDERARVWLTAGVGWGRFEIPEMQITEPGGVQYTVRERDAVFVEFPLGIGAAYDIIERWLVIEYEMTIAPHTGQSGEALENFQAVDAEGRLLEVGPFEHLDLTVLHTIGLALIL